MLRSAIGVAMASARSKARRAMGRASRARIRIWYCSFSQMRGTPKKKLGPISRRLCVTASIDSAKLTTEPYTSCITGDISRSATWHSGK